MQNLLSLLTEFILNPFFKLFYFLLVSYVLYFLLLENHSPIKTIAWILCITLIPYFGILIYLIVGSKFRKKYLFRKKRKLEQKRSADFFQIANQVTSIHSMYHLDLDSIVNIGKKLHYTSLTLRNNIQIYHSGTKFYKSHLHDLKHAKSSIFLEYYIFDNGVVANKIKKILIDKIAEGVKVFLLYDGLGSIWLKRKFIQELKHAGVSVEGFLPVWMPKPFRGINYRNHRKITVIDGKIAYVGGMNISDKYLKESPTYMRDIHLRIRGDSVESIKKVFIGDWNFSSKNKIPENFEKTHPMTMGKKLSQILISGPDLGYEAIKLTFFHLISTAKKNIYLTTPYFMPDETIISALHSVALAGVEVIIILSQSSDSKFVDACSRSYISDLLAYGIKVFLYKKGFLHSKLILIDELVTSVGSVNIDYRSFNQNLEITAIIYDKALYNSIHKEFIKDLRNSAEISSKSWSSRPKMHKIGESVARLFAPVF